MDVPGIDAPGMVLTVGSFDGLHRGHQALIQRARSLADTRGWPLVALFFEPTAREYLAPGQRAAPAFCRWPQSWPGWKTLGSTLPGACVSGTSCRP